MTQARAPRLSLLLPIGSRRAVLAAARIVFALLRAGCVELDLLRGEPGPVGRSTLNPAAPGAVLFIATRVPEAEATPDRLTAFEAALRLMVERAYEREGIASVVYDVQFL